MKIQTRIFVAKQFAKKHYASAMDAMKSLKGKFKKPTGMKAKAMAAGSKIKTFAKKNKIALVAGGGAAGTVAGYQAGKKKGVGQMKKSYEKSVLASSAKELGYKNFKQVQKLPMKDKKKIAQRAARKYLKSGADYITFYS
tara:strand:- start:58 stop:477 length:420 start_codon:yes stop_codon:yes gene_type:complete